MFCKHTKSQRNEAIRQRELFTCKQMEGESFDDFYVNIKRASEEVDICAGHNRQCEETQLKQVILMGLRDEELVQKLILLDTAALQDVVTTCRSFEAAKTASSAICTPSTAVRGISQYKKVKKKTLKTSSTPSKAPSNDRCPSCGWQHDKEKCPAANAQCLICDRKGHWPHTTQCPAKGAQCKLCDRYGHYDKCCPQTRRKQWRSKQHSSKRKENTPSGHKKHSTSQPKTNIRRVNFASRQLTSPIPQPIVVTNAHGHTSSSLHMLPDTGPDATVIGLQHLQRLKICQEDLAPPSKVKRFTADGSETSPALGSFQADITLGNNTCTAWIDVHDGVPTPSLSYKHCQELAIISKDFPRPILRSNTCQSSSRIFIITTFPSH